MELSSLDPNFGGISALAVQGNGTHFLALSDRAYWIRGRIVYEDRRPVAIKDSEIASLIGPDKKSAANWDTESIAIAGSLIYIGVEGHDSIPVYGYSPDGFPEYDHAIQFPEGIKELPRNQGLEAMVYRKSGRGGELVAISEKGLDRKGNIIGYLLGDGGRARFCIKRRDSFDITDAALLPCGDLLILERKYDIEHGASMRLRRIRDGDIKPDAVVDGGILMEADMQCHVDNMEALDVHLDRAGKSILTIMSDDNFLSLQRTLLLQFELTEPPSPEQKK